MHVSHYILALLHEVPHVEGVNHLVLLTKLGVDIGVLEDQALVESNNKPFENVLAHVVGHVSPFKRRLLYISLELKVHMALDPLV